MSTCIAMGFEANPFEFDGIRFKNTDQLQYGFAAWAHGVKALENASVVRFFRTTATTKNYLIEPETDELNRIVVMWLDFAEGQARRREQIFMQDWEGKLDKFLAFNERRVLSNSGKVSKKVADEHARQEYVRFVKRRREHKEALGEAESIKALENAAKQLEQEKPEGIE